MTTRTESARLRALARLHGIQTYYADVQGQRVEAPEATLRALLRAFGSPVHNESDCDDALRATLGLQSARPVDHVVVAWDGLLTHIDIHAPEPLDAPLLQLRVALEDGSTLDLPCGQCRVEIVRHAGPGHTTIQRFHLPDALHLPTGYHHLVCSAKGRQDSSLLLAAPTRCYPGERGDGRRWGLFAPLYALRGDDDVGAGSYAELMEFSRYTAHMGGGLVGTLPLLPCYHEPHSDPSPYLPISRLLWSEFYIDVTRIPFLDSCPETRDDISNILTSARAALRQSALVDYTAVENLRRTALHAAYHRLQSCSSFQSTISQFLAGHPHVSNYAAFRATRDGLRAPWQRWPAEARDGNLSHGFHNDEEQRFREFEQWLAHEQLADCLKHADAQEVGLYLDLPIGVHPEGYDTWRFRESFIGGVATGAPPDTVFTTGQRWGSPPLYPNGIRQQQYDYVREYLSHHMRAARMLRIDHVMGLHRIFCIPEGAEPAAGAYVRYRPDEWYAILSIESHRHKTILIGEDLGLVPPGVHRAMSHHGVSRMFVLYYEMDGIAAGRTPTVPSGCLAGLNTHDMPTFAAMWQGLDICQQQRMGILRPEQAPTARKARCRARTSLLGMLASVCSGITAAESLDDVLRCTLGWLGKSRARYVVVNIEDLWQETAQQNVPGSGDAFPSWRQRAAKTMEETWGSVEASHALELLRNAMRGSTHTPGGE